MMSSKRAAAKAAWELWKMAASFGTDGGKTVFKSHSRMNTGLSRSTYNSKLKRWKRFGVVRQKKTAEGYVFYVTAKAKTLRRQPPTKILRTDGLSSLIIFDIPQSKNRTRDILRRELVKQGFTGIRESCFISPFKISENIIELVKELELQNNVTIFSGKTTPIV